MKKDPASMVALVNRQARMLQAQRAAPLEIRMHPLDVTVLTRFYLDINDPTAWTKDGSLFGIPVVPDDAATRGQPEARYA